MAAGMLEKCALHGWIPVSIVPGRPCVWCRVDKLFAYIMIVNRVPHGGVMVMAAACISNGQQTWLHFINANLNAQTTYRDEILGPLSCHSSAAITYFIMTMHSPMSQGSVHNSRVCKRSLRCLKYVNLAFWNLSTQTFSQVGTWIKMRRTDNDQIHLWKTLEKCIGFANSNLGWTDFVF
jgi:hypothetical protein